MSLQADATEHVGGVSVQQTIYQIHRYLSDEKLVRIIFLSHMALPWTVVYDVIGRRGGHPIGKPDGVKFLNALYSYHGYAEMEAILTEALSILKFRRAIKELNLRKRQGFSLDPILEVLYRIYENLDDHNDRAMIYLVDLHLSREQQHEATSLLHRFLFLFQLGKLQPSAVPHAIEQNYQFLIKILPPRLPRLEKLINEYRGSTPVVSSITIPMIEDERPIKIMSPPLNSSIPHDTSYDSYYKDHPPYELNPPQQVQGICVIINNADFQKYWDKRPENWPKTKLFHNRLGSDKDEKSLTTVFESFGFKVDSYQDLTRDEILRVMTFYSKDFDHSDFKMFIVCILSHGGLAKIYSVDYREVTIKEIVDLFPKDICTSLTDRPKLFFIQACQGDTNSIVQADGSGDSDGYHISGADMFIAFPSLPGFASYRDPYSGTSFIKTLCKYLESYPKVDLMRVSEKWTAALENIIGDIWNAESGKYEAVKQQNFEIKNLKKPVMFKKCDQNIDFSKVSESISKFREKLLK